MLRRHASTGLDLARRARLSTRRATRQLSASASSASASVWGPRIALASLPIGTAAGLYLWRKWDSGGQLNNNTTRVEDADSDRVRDDGGAIRRLERFDLRLR